MSAYPHTRPLFIYGTLRALPLLAWAPTGDASSTAAVERLARPGKVDGYARYIVRGCDYHGPMPSEEEESSIDGLSLVFKNPSQRKKLEDFEGETYRITPITVTLDAGEIVEADMYVWAGETDKLSAEPWNLSTFEEGKITGLAGSF